MTNKELRKISDRARRKVFREFGFHQKDYTNWMVKDGYFFCLVAPFYDHISLEVKPLYADDLWWEMLGISSIYFMYLIHHGRKAEAVRLVEEYKSSGFKCHNFYEKRDTYEVILDYCNEKNT